MTENPDHPLGDAKPAPKRQSIFIQALKLGLLVALVSTIVDGVHIWGEPLPAAASPLA